MMSDETLQTRLAVLEEKIDSIRLQQARFFSHFDSEQRARDDLKNRVTRLEERLDSGRWSFQSVMTIVMTIATLATTIIVIWKE